MVLIYGIRLICNRRQKERGTGGAQGATRGVQAAGPGQRRPVQPRQGKVIYIYITGGEEEGKSTLKEKRQEQAWHKLGILRPP